MKKKKKEKKKRKRGVAHPLGLSGVAKPMAGKKKMMNFGL
jgi:hypothetical protein